MIFHLGPWDLGLVLVVSLQATLLAYLARPRWKAIVLSLPVPFTVATLAVGLRPNITHVLGLVLLLAYTHGVRLLYIRLRLPILLAIVTAAAGYILVASSLVPWLPSVAVLALAVGLFRALPERAEPDFRSKLPVWLKLPIIAAVIIGLVILKGWLQGFMALFPMVGVVAAYEARHSLWTMGRQIPVLMMATVPLMAVSHITQPLVGLGLSLAAGWLAYLAVFLPVAWHMRSGPSASLLLAARVGLDDLV